MGKSKWPMVLVAMVTTGCSAASRPARMPAARETPEPALASKPADASPVTSTFRSAEPAPYRVVSTKDVSITGRSRSMLRVVIQDKNASAEQVHAALLEAAKADGAEKVMVAAYWPGDDTTSIYSAGRLEWGKDGRGWDSSDYIGPDGRFDQATLAQRTGETKFGLSEEERMALYKEFVRVEDTTEGQATDDAKKRLARQHGLTLHQLYEIAGEGLRKDWPFPARQ